MPPSTTDVPPLRARDEAPPRSGGLGLARSAEHRLIAGVAAGIARAINAPVGLVRGAFVILALIAGVGVIGYIAAWILLPTAAEPAAARRGDTVFQMGAIIVVAIGATMLLSQFGFWLGSGPLAPAVLLVTGAVVLWTRDERERIGAGGGRVVGPLGGRAAAVRLVVGAALVVAGIATLLARSGSLAVLREAMIAIVATIVGAALVLGPWLRRLWDAYLDERRERIRSEERSEFAARLHDSVLQTLALIQRAEDRPRDMARLARRQERELRAWLFAEHEPAAAGRLRAALAAIVADVEDLHDIDIELVTVGDAEMSDRLEAVAGALREALVNAAKFSGERRAFAYVEVEPGRLEAFVRDRGVGFDPARVGPDRRGIAHSIVARVRRHGGEARVTSSPGAGVEVHIEMPLAVS